MLNQCGFIKGCETTDAIQSWKNIERKTSLSTWRSSTWRRLLITSRTSSPLTSECTKDRPYHLFCSSFAWTPSPLTFRRLTRGRSCSKNNSELEEEAQQWHNRLDEYGLHLNTEKTEYMEWGLQTNETIYIDGVDLKKVQQFKYLCSVICSDGESLLAAPAHVHAAWMKWRQVTGVICNHRMPLFSMLSSQKSTRPWSTQSPCMHPKAVRRRQSTSKLSTSWKYECFIGAFS